jgi:hypothetical protein
MSDAAVRLNGGSAYTELTRQLAHYESQKNTWMCWYYSTKVVILVLGATIPILTTFDAWPWVIAIVGGTITVVEGLSQVWHFHDRYIAARVLRRGLVKERILYESAAAPYGADGDRDHVLAERISGLFDTYESHVLSALKLPADAGTPPQG